MRASCGLRELQASNETVAIALFDIRQFRAGVVFRGKWANEERDSPVFLNKECRLASLLQPSQFLLGEGGLAVADDLNREFTTMLDELFRRGSALPWRRGWR